MTNSDPSSPQPSNELLRRPKPNVIDQRQQQIDPAGRQRQDPDDRTDTNRKQPGGSDPERREGEDLRP